MIKATALLCAGAAALGLTACGGSGSGSSTGSSAAGAGSGSAVVDLQDNSFKPATITGKPGSTVRLELKNDGAAAHTFTIDSQHVDQAMAPGKTATVTVKIPSSGFVQFYCRYHKALGMVGTLEGA
jgi:plastocyanin